MRRFELAPKEGDVTMVSHPLLPNRRFYLLPDLTLIDKKTLKIVDCAKENLPFDDNWREARSGTLVFLTRITFPTHIKDEDNGIPATEIYEP